MRRFETDIFVDGEFEATVIKKLGGTSAQFLKADGSVDSNTYLVIGDLADYARISIDNNFTASQTIAPTTGDAILNVISTDANAYVDFQAGTFNWAAGVDEFSDEFFIAKNNIFGIDKRLVIDNSVVNVINKRITNVNNPIALQDAATKNYVDISLAEQFLETTLTNTQQLAAGTGFQNVNGFDTPSAALNTITGLTLNTTTGAITCTESGVYRIHFETTLKEYDGNNRTNAEVRLALNGNLVKGTLKRGYHRQNSTGFANYSFSKTVELIPGNLLRIQARNTANNREHELRDDNTILRLTRIKT